MQKKAIVPWKKGWWFKIFLHLLYFFYCILPDILKKFNPDLQGFSKGQGQLQKGFNMAVAGAKTSYAFFFSCRVKLFNLSNIFWRLFSVSESFLHKSKLSLRPWKKTRWDFSLTFKTLCIPDLVLHPQN